MNQVMHIKLYNIVIQTITILTQDQSAIPLILNSITMIKVKHKIENLYLLLNNIIQVVIKIILQVIKINKVDNYKVLIVGIIRVTLVMHRQLTLNNVLLVFL
jgi:hypothetical protein